MVVGTMLAISFFAGAAWGYWGRGWVDRPSPSPSDKPGDAHE